MSKFKGTPGEWLCGECSDGEWYIEEKANPGVQIGYFLNTGDNMTEKRARLAALAPELLEALQGMLEVFIDSDSYAGYEDMETVKVARAAIAKATGANHG